MRYRWVGIGVVVLFAAWAWHGSGQQPGTRPEAKGEEDTLLRQGEYLVNQVGMCGDCHTPQDAKGQPDRARALQGSALPIRPKKETKDWADEAPDITRGGLAGEWG